ncbi:coxsackievirus and adenovirus receptor homolog [Betta splendens]|uniref:Coxsackievirus and adenovirus receptor homolog n=1 Tax=Betta splendens TaxID=158456 RepID=A0A6P7LWL6_BETSP|nr:coxsackievirus and adenovirus receptor homolog [Betta splendens]
MELLLLSLCLVSLSGSTFADGNGPEIIKVKEGNNAILPCYIKDKDILSKRFEWKKDGKKDVYLYDGSPLSGQDEQFIGRVSHFDHELKNGDASIKIRDTKVSDTGFYTCNLPNLTQTFTVHLRVGKVAKLHTKKLTKMKDGVPLLCLVSDASPDFQLKISWFDSSGNKLNSQLEIKKNGELHILQTTVTKSDTYRCDATMEELSHQIDDNVTVTDEDLNNTSDIPVGVWVGLAVMALIIVAGAGVIYKLWKKNRSRI